MSLSTEKYNIKLSITNKASERVLDYDEPFSFLDFIKTNDIGISLKGQQEYYNKYIKEWCEVKELSSNISDKAIHDKYLELLKDIAVNYTTYDESAFLSKLDFTKNSDIRIALSFYSKKLIEVSNHIRDKRNEIGYTSTKNKSKGSSYGLKKALNELLESFIIRNFNNMQYDVERMIEDCSISQTELYELPIDGIYNMPPDNSKHGHVDFDIGNANIFLGTDDEITNNIFSSIGDFTKELLEISDVYKNRRRLTKANIGADYFYISVDVRGNITRGKLFTADDKISNLSNLEYPSFASNNILETLTPESIGFFRPQKTTNVSIEGIEVIHEIEEDALEVGSTYIYPDPRIYTNDYKIFKFSIPTHLYKRDLLNGGASNQPNINENHISSTGYVSKISGKNVGDGLDDIFNSGYMDDYKEDLVGNKFGLIKASPDPNKMIFGPKRNTDYIKNYTLIKTLVLDGYTFKDEIFEGSDTPLKEYSFDYSINEHKSKYLYRSGISTKTALDSDNPSFSHGNKTPLTLSFRYFYDNVDIKYPVDFRYFNKLLLVNTKLSNGDIYDENFIEPPYEALQNSERFNIKENVFKENMFTRKHTLGGKIFSKTINSDKTLGLFDAIPYISTKYSNHPKVLDELNGSILSFDISDQYLFITTKSYMIIEKLSFDGEYYTSNNNTQTVVEYKTISNMFKVGHSVYFYTVDMKNISFELIAYEFIDGKLKVIYNSTADNRVSEFKFDQRLKLLKSATISHNSRNELFSLTFIGTDIANFPILYKYIAYMDEKINKFVFTVAEEYIGSPISDNRDGMYVSLRSTKTPVIENGILII